jgi:hypothetical protein
MGRFGLLARAVLAILLLAGLARAEDEVPPAEAWQVVITAQVEAFRAHDALGAFQYAAAPFQTAFPNAEAFFATIIGSGYAPIMESTAHRFGKFTQLDEQHVAQEVKLTAKDLSLFEAIYVLTKEESGWRVSGVQLVKTPGMAI